MGTPTRRILDLDRPERFEQEVIPYTAYIMRHAQALTKQRHDAEDLVQETMLKAYTSFESFREGSNTRSWLYRIMVNTWVDKFRQAQRRPIEDLRGDLTEPSATSRQGPARGASQSAEVEAMTKILGRAQSAMLSLPDDLRATVYYADVAGYRNTEIAVLFDIPVGTVASRLHRGRRSLREMLLLADCA